VVIELEMPRGESRGRASSARIDRWVTNRPVRGVSLLLAALLIAVAAVSGGLDAAGEARAVPSVAVGVPVDLGPLRLTVTAARVTPGRLGPATAETPADHWVVVLATVEATCDETYTLLKRHVALEGVNGIVDKEPTLLSVDDGTYADQFHPDLPVRIAMAWGQDAAAAAPRRLDLRLVGAEYLVDVNSLYSWELTEDAAVVRGVPVVDGRTER
jgi:hypothetical protein